MEHHRGNHVAKGVTRLILFPLIMVMFLLVGGSFAFASKALFVVGGDSLSPGDKVIRNHLKGRGFEVVVQNDRNVTAASAAGKDLIVISESAVSTRLKNKFRKVSVPLICLDAYQYDDLGMAARDLSAGSKFGHIEEQQSVRIEAGGHPLAVRLPAGQVVEVGQRDITMSWGVPGKNAIWVATLVNSTDKFAIFAYDKGKKMPGLVAPARRIGFFLTSKAAKSLTADGWKLFNAAVNWAVKLEEPEPCPDGNASITFVNNCGETIWVAQLGNGASKKCSVDADCGSNEHHGSCVNGACDKILCVADADCGSDIQFCKQSNCKSNSDCPAVSCYTDTDCPLWNDPAVPQKCIAGGQCTSDNNCTTVSCYADTDCPFWSDPTDPQTCLGGGLCQSNADCPAIACSESVPCPSGATCENSICTPSCQPGGHCLCKSASDCPGPNATCENNRCSEAVGYCSKGCRPGGQCACTTTNSSGLPVNPCAGGQTCQNSNLCSVPYGYCSAACRPSGQCACTTNAIPGLPAPLACPGAATCQDHTSLCSGVGLCTYKNLPSPGYWQLPHDGNKSKQICVPADNNESSPRAWGGRFWARTGCPDNFATCKPRGAPCDNNTACCNNSCQGGVCQAGIPACLTGDCKNALECQVSGSVPVTLFEVNYAASNVAYYDASLADSYNVPIMATPKTAGCPAAGCTGNLNAMCPQLLQSSGKSCTTSADCPAGGVCDNSTSTCVIGCISACNQCREGINVVTLECNEVVPDGDGVTKYVDLYCCTNNLSCNLGTPTCFNDTDCASIECSDNAGCGSGICTQGICAGMTCNPSTYLCEPVRPCPTDCDTHPGYTCNTNIGACVPPANCCGPYNPLWRKAMETYVSAFKEACPTAYSYQYDDPTSLFTCPNSGKGVDYTITFCPSP